MDAKGRDNYEATLAMNYDRKAMTVWMGVRHMEVH